MSNNVKSPAPIDRADERVAHVVGVSGAIRAFLDRVRSGDLPFHRPIDRGQYHD